MATPESEAQQIQAELEQRPDFLLERFKSVDDQAKAYAEAEKEMNRLRAQSDQERAEFTAALEQMAELSQQQQTPQPQSGLDPQTQQLLAAYTQARDNGDVATELAITMALQQQQTAALLDDRFSKLTPQLDERRQTERDMAFQIAQDRVRGQYGDAWADVAPDVNKFLNEHAALLPPTNDPAAFEAAIREATQIVVNEKAAARLAQMESDRVAKLNAQTATGSASGRFQTDTDEKKQEWQRVVDAPTGSYSNLRRG